MQAVHAIRDVRNDFAHSAGDPTLAESHHQKRLQRVLPQAPFSARATVRFITTANP